MIVPVAFAQSQTPDAPTAVAVYSIESQKLEVRWSSSDSSTTSFKIQWKSGSEGFDSSRQVSSDPATSIESVQSTSAGDRYKTTLSGLTDGVEYTVRVIAVNSNGDSDPSSEVTGTPQSTPGQVREFWENEVIKIFEGSRPWLRETWDHITGENARVFFTEESGFHPGVDVGCSVNRPTAPRLRECYAKLVGIERGYYNLIYGIIHELAHVYTLANSVTATPAPLGVAHLYFHDLVSSRGGQACDPVELYTDAVTLVDDEDLASSATSTYWTICSLVPAAPSEQALDVVRSATAGQMPSWFADTYNDSNGNPNLERVWADVKAIPDFRWRASVVFQLRNEFGGYCDDHQATASAFSDGVTRNPWRDGGCVPEAPEQVAVTAAGSGKLTVSWQEPYDGGWPIQGYKVQWKSGTQDYSSSRRAVVTHLSDPVLDQTISGLTNDESHTLRVLAYNQNGDGAAAEVTATPTATETTAPTLLLARLHEQHSWLRLIWNETLAVSSVPASTAFTVNVNGVSRGIDRIDVPDGNVLNIRLSGTVGVSDSVTVSYTVPTGADARPLRDSAGNNAAGFSGKMVRNDKTQVAITSDPGTDMTYSWRNGYGGQDVVEATVTFSEPVVVTGVPELKLDVGGQTRHARYHSGSGSTSLVFRYSVTQFETDTDGVAVPLGSIQPASLVRYVSTNAVAPPPMKLDPQAGHLVDAVRPFLVSADAVANGSDIALWWDKDLDEDSVPHPLVGFVVQDSSTSTRRTINSISVAGRVVTLTLSSTISATDQLTVSWGWPYFVYDGVTVDPLTDTVGNYAKKTARPLAVSIKQPNNPPEFPSSEDGVRSVAENMPANRNIGAPVAATDADNNRLTYSISGTDAAFFDVVATSGQLRTKAALDHESRDSYSFTMSVHDGKDIYGNADTTIDDTISVTVTVNDVDEPPVIAGAATVDDYDENGTGDVAYYAADDPEGATTIITWSLGGTDRGDFEISDAGVLTFKDPPDYERPADSGGNNEYLVTVVATEEGGLRGTLDVTITVRDVNEGPTVTGDEAPSFPENGVRAVATYRATDPERDTVTWSVSGTDGDDFEISETGVLTFVDTPDFESPADANQDNDYLVTVEARDEGSNTATLEVTVAVTNSTGPEEPTITTTSNPSPYRENGTGAVYTFRARDPQGRPVSWTATGIDSHAFEISSSGVLTFRSSPDFEDPTDADRDNVYEVTVVVTDDQGLTDTVEVTVTVSDVNEGPELSGLQSLSFTENQATDRVLATYGATDPEDPSAVITRWSLSGSDAGDFTISEAGELSFRNVPDFERPADSGRDNVYEFSVRASDGRNYGYLPVTVTVNDVNETPVVTGTTSFTYRENATATIYTFSATDPERADISWSPGGSDGDDFTITRDSRGRGVLAFASPPDFEDPTDADRDNVYEVTVEARDGAFNSGTLEVTVTVSDQNEGPVVAGPQSLSFTENQATDRVLAIYTATDPEDPSALISRWSLSGRDAGDFTISEAGELSFRGVPDFERPADSGRDNVYEFSVRASDGRNYGYLAVTVTVEDINEAPVITTTSRTEFSFRENGTATIYTFSATDPERGTITWSTGGSDGDDFMIAPDSRGRGVLAFASPPDFEDPTDADRDNVYEVTVVVTDDQGLTDTVEVTVTVSDVNEGPELSGLQSLSFTENQATDRVLATYGATDPEDPSAVITRWSLSGSDAGDFTISEAGELSFRNVPDFERPADSGRDNVYEFSVRASDGRNYGYLAVTVTVEDINEAPVITTTSRTEFSFRENGTATIYTFSATDPERGTITWSTGGADGDDFTITRDSRGRGVLAFASPPDFEDPTDADRDNVYEVTVEARDGAFNSGTLEVTVTVSDQNEGPVVAGPQSLSFTENQATDRVLAIYTATDPEDPSALISRWSLSGRDAGDFTISEAGELSFRGVPDFERPADSGRDNVYEFSVRASDGRNYGYLAVTVTVEDINEAPVITTTSRTEFSFRENGTATIYTFSATDPERGTITWSTGGSDGDDFMIAPDSRGRGVLAFASPPDFEDPTDADRDNVYEVTVQVRDGAFNSGTLEVTVTVSELNEGPELSGLQSLSFTENQATDRVLATYGATDPEDPSAVITRWSLSGSDAGDFTISEAGELSFRNVPDFERPADSGRDNVYEFSVRASDGRNYGYLPVTVTVNDVNETPVVTGTTSFTYRENATATIYTFSATDPERADISWSPGGSDGDDFTITRDSRGRGVLAFNDPPDFENPTDADRDNVYEVTVEARDGAFNSGTLEVTVTVSDQNEGPVVAGPQSLSFTENQATDRVLAIYTATDPEDPSALISRWSLSGRDAGDFTISEAGELSFRGVPDFERPADSGRDNVYEFSVRASDGRNYGYLAVTVTVEDINEAPVITTTSRTEFSFRENGTATIYTFSATDPERGTITWSTGGADGDDFTITPDSRGRGVLTFRSPPDFEDPTDADRDNVYEVTVVVTDDQGLTDTVEVTVTVSDVNEGPELSGLQSLSFTENQATDRVLATYGATDPEDPSAVITRWSLSGSDAGDFTISEAGELSFRNVPDFERPADSGARQRL